MELIGSRAFKRELRSHCKGECKAYPHWVEPLTLGQTTKFLVPRILQEHLQLVTVMTCNLSLEIVLAWLTKIIFCPQLQVKLFNMQTSLIWL